jgi:hypothetical protein
MQIKLEFVAYDEELNKFTIDKNSYFLDLDEEQKEHYELVKNKDFDLYNWLKESDFFIQWIKEEVYQDDIKKKIAISDIDGISFLRFYFFKVTSSDIHYEYFKNFFNIHTETEWQDREDTGREILEYLSTKQQELIFELKS